MPIYTVKAPDGKVYELKGPEGSTPEQLSSALYSQVPDAATPFVKESGVIAQGKKGFEQLVSGFQTTGEAALGDKNEAARAALARQAEFDRKYEQSPSLERTAEAFKEKGFFSGLGQLASDAPDVLAAQIPQFGLSYAGGRAGAAAGAKAGSALGPRGKMVGALLGGGAGLLGASYPGQLSGNIEAQAEEQVSKDKPIDINLPAAARTAVPQAAFDAVSNLPFFGRGIFGKMLGIPKEVLERGGAEAVEKLAKESLAATVSKGTALGFAVEFPTEILQQALQRNQAGQSLTSPEAYKQYGEIAYQTALLSPLGTAGRALNKSGAREQVQQKVMEQRREADAAAAAAAPKPPDITSPDYLQQVQTEYQEAEKLKADLKSQLRKVEEDSVTETADRLHNQDIQEQIKAMIPNLEDLAKKYNEASKVAPAFTPEPVSGPIEVPEAVKVPEAPKPILTVGDALDNPLSRFSKAELPPEAVAYIDTHRKNLGKPVLEDYSIEDIRDAMPDSGIPGTQGTDQASQTQTQSLAKIDLNSLIAAKTGYTPDVTYKPEDIINIANQKNIATNTDGFKFFLQRATGDNDLTKMEQPQLHSAFTALSGLPEFDETQYLPEKTSATDYSPQQYNLAVQQVSALASEKDIPSTQALQVAKKATGLTRDSDVQLLLQNAYTSGDLNLSSKGDFITAQPAEQAEFRVEESFAPAQPTGFNVMRGDQLLYSTQNQEEANAKVESLGKVADPAMKQIDKSIASERSTIAASQRSLDIMETAGLFRTPKYQQASAQHAALVQKSNDDIQRLNEKKAYLQLPVTIQTTGKPSNVRVYKVKEKGVSDTPFNTREEALTHALENLPAARLNELASNTNAPGFARRLQTEIERRQNPPKPFLASKPEVTQPEIGVVTQELPEITAKKEAFKAQLLPTLKQFGLGDVTLQIEDGMKAEGSYVASVIKVALDANNPVRVLRHESLHGLKDLGFFTPGQWKVLENQADKVWIDKYLKQRNINGQPIQGGQQSRFEAYQNLYNGDMDAVREEAIADAFGDFDVNGAPKGLFATLLQKMQDFFRALRSAFTGAGYETADDVFGKVERGELKATAKATAEEKPSVRTTAKGLLNPNILPKYEKVIDDVVKEMGLTPEEFASTSLIHQTGKAGTEQFESDKLGGLPEVIQFLQDQRRNSGLPLLDVEKPADRKIIAKLMATEAMAAIRSGGANLEWYDSIINKTLAMAGLKYPELNTDINARMAFKIATAITSQGLNVEDNLGFSMKVYDQFRQNKKFPEVGQGADQGAMINNFKLANYLMNDMGANTLRQFLETEFTVEEMRSAGFNIAGELGDENVLGSSVFGPKIGFGFYSNLNGNFDPVTMDMWFMRTIGRLTGKLKSFRQDLYDSQLNKFRNELDTEGSNGVFSNQFDQDEVDLAKSDDKAAEALARKVKSAHERDYKINRAGYDDDTRGKSKLVAASETMIKSLDAPKDAPANGSERRNLRDVVRQMVDIVEEKYGKRVPPASLQAVIWYPEQELYKAMGVKLRVTSQNYAGAIEKILKGEGYGESDLGTAAKLGSRTAQQLAKSAVAKRPQATGAEPVKLGALQAGEKEALLERGRKRVVLAEEKETPKRKKLIFEVAPDPNNKVLTGKWRALLNQDRIKISEKIGNIIIKKALNEFGLKGYVDTQVGSYLDDTNPSFALYLDSGDAVAMTNFLGHALSQDSMMVLSPKPAKGLDKTGAVRINIGDLSSSSVDNIYQRLRTIEVNGEKPVGGQSYMNGHMLILNYSNVSTEELASLINKKLDNGYELIKEDVYTAFPEKKDYDYANSSSDPRGNAGVLRQASRNLRTEATQLLQKELRAFKPEAVPATASGTKASLRTVPDTPEFKRFFGDSKVVDANGEPKLMYHGTARDIKEFKPQQAGAIFITDNPDTAARYSQESAQWLADHAPETLTAKQMADTVKTGAALARENGYTNKQIAALLKDKSFFKTDEFREAASKYLGSGSNIMPVYVSAKNPFDYQNKAHLNAVMQRVPGLKAEGFDRTNNWTTVESPEVQKAIRDLGFDSFYVSEHGDKNLAVYEPTQIKSATGNIGTYDPTNPDIRYSLRTAPDTPEFKQWFKRSAVVDKDGKPMVVYHGTKADISEFKLDKKAHRSGNPDGYYFTPSTKDASRYAGEDGNVMPVYLSIQNPFVQGSKVNYRMIDQFEQELRKDNPNLKDDWIESKVNSFKRSAASGNNWFPGIFPNISFPTEAMTRVLEAGGYDGFKDGDHVIAIRPDQIKSAIGNRGTYDQFNNDIRYSLRTDVAEDIRNMPNGAAIEAAINRVTTARQDLGYAERMTTALANRSQSFSYFRQKFFDRYNRLNDVERQIAQQMGGVARLADQSAHAAALQSDAAAGVAASALGVGNRMGGIPVYRNGYTTVSNENGTVKGAVEIFSPLAKYGDPKIYQVYQFWAGAKRGKRLMASGKEELYTQQDMAYAKELEQKYPEFASVQKDWIKYNDGLVKYAVDTGVISAQNAAEFTRYSDYVPFYRQLEGERTVGPNIFQSISGVKGPQKITGSEAPLADFLETIVRNTQSIIQAGMKNVAAQKAVDGGVMLQMVRKLDHVAYGPNTVTVLEKGQKVSYECADKLWVDAVSSLNLPELPFLNFIAAPANLLRTMVTKDPGFMLANLMRDSVSAYVTSGAKLTPVASAVKEFGNVLMNNSPEYQKLLSAGVLGGYEFSRNVEASAEAFGKDLREKTGTKTSFETATSPFTFFWNALEKGTEASDAATRIAVYKATLAETGNEAEAIHRALEVMNFNRKGSSVIVRVAAAAIPFLNARVQGLDVFFRSGIRPFLDGNATEREKQVQKAMFIRGMTILGLSVMYAAAISGNPDYENQEEETKDNNWIIPMGEGKTPLKIPIPFEVGTLFKTVPERIYRSFFMADQENRDTTEDLQKSMRRALQSTFGFNPVPQIAAPLLEARDNYSVFTQRPIVGQNMQGISPEFQVGPGTSKWAEILGQQAKMSPMMIDHVFKGYTGTMGVYAADLLDAAIGAASPSEADKPSKRIDQMPIIKRFLANPEARGKITSYFDLKHQVDTTVRTINLLEKQADPNLPNYVEKNAQLFAARDFMNGLNKQMDELQQQANMIRSADIPADEKRDMLAEITKAQNLLVNDIRRIRNILKP